MVCCETCKHWSKNLIDWETREPTICTLIDSFKNKSKEAAIEASCRAVLFTSPTFGCILHEEAELITEALDAAFKVGISLRQQVHRKLTTYERSLIMNKIAQGMDNETT